MGMCCAAGNRAHKQAEVLLWESAVLPLNERNCPPGDLEIMLFLMTVLVGDQGGTFSERRSSCGALRKVCYSYYHVSAGSAVRAGSVD